MCECDHIHPLRRIVTTMLSMFMLLWCQFNGLLLQFEVTLSETTKDMLATIANTDSIKVKRFSKCNLFSTPL